MSDPRTIVVGIDGAHFELIDRWIESEELENIASLINEGVSTDMQSCLPPVTSPNWKCYSSSMNPGKLGIFWWENIDIQTREVYYPESRKNRPDELWDHLSRAGYEVCVIGTPLTYPPKKINGVLVAGGPDAAESGYAYPSEIEAKLRDDYNYQVHPETSISVDRERAAAEIHDLISTRFETGLGLLKHNDFDFVQITTFYINVLHHHFWDDEETKRGWKIIDHYIGKLREQYPETNLLLMSDHGANEMDVVFNINTWLAENSYLTYKWQYRLMSTLADSGVNRKKLRTVTDKLRITSALKRLMPDSAIETVPADTAEIKQEAKTENIDWDRSKAIASGQGPVYITDSTILNDIKTELEGVSVDGKYLFENVYEREEIYDGQFLDEAPSLILDQASNVHVRGSIGRDAVFEIPSATGWRAENKKIGLFVAEGPDISGMIDDTISILDLTPTILSLFDIESPADIDGVVREEILSEQ